MKNWFQQQYSLIKSFNEVFAVKLTQSVGTMWCAYFFACLAFVSLPAAIAGGIASLISWIAQTFIQLVLLSVIMVGQDIQSRKTESRDIEDHDNIISEFNDIKEIHEIILAEIQEIKAMHVDLKDMHDNKTGCGFPK